MQNIEEKKAFLRETLSKKLAAADPATERKWGKMDLQQMVEHIADYTRVGSGKLVLPLQIPLEHVPKYQEFLGTEKLFRENTPNSLLPDTPPAYRHADIGSAIAELQYELDDLFTIFQNDPGKKVTHPFFGELGFEMSVQLLHKHALHHLRQFGLVE